MHMYTVRLLHIEYSCTVFKKRTKQFLYRFTKRFQIKIKDSQNTKLFFWSGDSSTINHRNMKILIVKGWSFLYLLQTSFTFSILIYLNYVLTNPQAFIVLAIREICSFALENFTDQICWLYSALPTVASYHLYPSPPSPPPIRRP
jgi:hypothetical protein